MGIRVEGFPSDPPPLELTDELVDEVLARVLPRLSSAPKSLIPTYIPPGIVEAYVPEPDAKLARLVGKSSLVAISGHRGAGKTDLAFRAQELRSHASPA